MTPANPCFKLGTLARNAQARGVESATPAESLACARASVGEHRMYSSQLQILIVHSRDCRHFDPQVAMAYRNIAIARPRLSDRRPRAARNLVMPMEDQAAQSLTAGNLSAELRQGRSRAAATEPVPREPTPAGGWARIDAWPHSWEASPGISPHESRSNTSKPASGSPISSPCWTLAN